MLPKEPVLSFLFRKVIGVYYISSTGFTDFQIPTIEFHNPSG